MTSNMTMQLANVNGNFTELPINDRELNTPGAALRAFGGYDRITGEAFSGVLSRSPGSLQTGSENAITPLTTFLHYLGADKEADFSNSLSDSDSLSDISNNDLYEDYFDNSMDKDKRLALIEQAYQLHKSADVIAAALKGAYKDVDFDDNKHPKNLHGYVYQAMADKWSKDSGFDSGDYWENVMSEASDSIATVTDSTKATINDLGAEQVEKLWNFVTEALEGVDATEVEISKRLRAVEIVTWALRDNPDVSMDDLTSVFVTENGNNTDPYILYSELEASADIGGLGGYFASTASSNWSRDGIGDYLDRTKISDEGFTLMDGESKLTFDHETGNITFKHEDIDLEIEGEYINDYTLLVNVEVGGVVEPVTVKSTGDGYSFEYDGKTFTQSDD